MIKATITLYCFIFCLVCSAQLKVTEMPSFYEEGEVINSSDMTSNGFDPIVVYTTNSQIKSKSWKENAWVDFGSFPKVENCGTVKLKFWGNIYYALVNTSNGWTAYSREIEKSDWAVYGQENFAKSSVFTQPVINFNAGNFMIYEHSQSTDDLVIYSYQNDKIVASESVMEKTKTEIKSDFQYVSTPAGESLMSWTSFDGQKKIFKVTSTENGSKSEPIMKGLKMAKIKEVIQMTIKNYEVYLVYISSADKLQFAKLDEGYEKWKKLKFKESTETLDFEFSRDMSFITKAETKPMFYRFKDGKWESGIELDITKMDCDENISFKKAVGNYYLKYVDSNGKIIIQQISNY